MPSTKLSLEGCDLAAFSVAVVLPQSCLLSPTPAHRPVAALAYGENKEITLQNLSATMPAHFSCLASLFFLINFLVITRYMLQGQSFHT